MIRRLFDFFKRGEFVYRTPPKHSCWLPAGGHRGDVWKCKCGKIHICLGLSMFVDLIIWKEIKNEDIETELNEDELF